MRRLRLLSYFFRGLGRMLWEAARFLWHECVEVGRGK
jgi:hypothetical protein